MEYDLRIHNIVANKLIDKYLPHNGLMSSGEDGNVVLAANDTAGRQHMFTIMVEQFDDEKMREHMVPKIMLCHDGNHVLIHGRDHKYMPHQNVVDTTLACLNEAMLDIVAMLRIRQTSKLNTMKLWRISQDEIKHDAFSEAIVVAESEYDAKHIRPVRGNKNLFVYNDDDERPNSHWVVPDKVKAEMLGPATGSGRDKEQLIMAKYKD